MTANAVSFFTPTILRLFGYSALSAQIHSIPVWMASAVTCVVTGLASDLCRHRYGFIMAGVAVGIVGYSILLCQGPVNGGMPLAPRYAAMFLLGICMHMVQPITLGWLSNNLSGHYKRSFGAAIQVGFGNLAGLVTSNIFISKQAPAFTTGYATCLAFLVLHAVLSTVLAVMLVRENKKRDRGERDDRYNLPPEQLENLGDDHPSYRFMI
jgi:hypothetical protein